MKLIHRINSNFRPFLRQYYPKRSEGNVWLMIYLVAAIVVLILLLGIGATLQNAFSPPVKSASGDLAIEISSFVKTIPRSGSEAYDMPTYSQRNTMSEAFEAIETENLSRASSLVDPLAYDVVQYEDTVTGRTYTMLSERRNTDGSWPHAWGMYIFSPKATSNSVIEVVHPFADVYSEKVGLETFREANARYLFIAGAHRRANSDGTADVAHARTSVFDQIHRVAIESSTVVFQPHGFSQANHPDYGEVVVSAGTADSTPLAQRVYNVLRNVGFDTRLYDGVSYLQVGGTKNIQQSSTRAVGGSFLHLEVSRSVREDDLRRALLTNTLAGNLR